MNYFFKASFSIFSNRTLMDLEGKITGEGDSKKSKIRQGSVSFFYFAAAEFWRQ